MSAKPVYRYPPRSHTATCPCPRCVQCRQNQPSMKNGDFGIIGPGVLIIAVVAVVGFWPAMVWHGYGGPTGTDWRWDIHSTIAELVYFGVIAFVVLVCWLGHLSDKPPRPPKGRLRVEATRPASGPPMSTLPPPPPVCFHRNAVKVESDYWRKLGQEVILAWWCPDCETQIDPPAFRASELRPDATWPKVRL